MGHGASREEGAVYTTTASPRLSAYQFNNSSLSAASTPPQYHPQRTSNSNNNRNTKNTYSNNNNNNTAVSEYYSSTVPSLGSNSRAGGPIGAMSPAVRDTSRSRADQAAPYGGGYSTQFDKTIATGGARVARAGAGRAVGGEEGYAQQGLGLSDWPGTGHARRQPQQQQHQQPTEKATPPVPPKAKAVFSAGEIAEQADAEEQRLAALHNKKFDRDRFRQANKGGFGGGTDPSEPYPTAGMVAPLPGIASNSMREAAPAAASRPKTAVGLTAADEELMESILDEIGV